MNFFACSKENIDLTIRGKGVVPIGIYGSFQPANMMYPEAMRDYLLSKGHLAYLSLDLQRLCPNPGNLSDDEYNLKISELMTVYNRVHIVFIFLEGEGEHNVNQSASIELDRLYLGGQKHVMTFFEHGSFNQSRSLFRALLGRNVSEWAKEFFERHADESGIVISQDNLETGRMFCYSRILSDRGTYYLSREDYERQIALAWAEQMV